MRTGGSGRRFVLTWVTISQKHRFRKILGCIMRCFVVAFCRWTSLSDTRRSRLKRGAYLTLFPGPQGMSPPTYLFLSSASSSASGLLLHRLLMSCTLLRASCCSGVPSHVQRPPGLARLPPTLGSHSWVSRFAGIPDIARGGNNSSVDLIASWFD